MLITMATYALSTGYSLVIEDRTRALSLSLLALTQ
jgi:hypothetical protein